MSTRFERIVLFTSNSTGGIPQFVVQMVSELQIMGKTVKAFIPQNEDLIIDDCIASHIERYIKPKSLFANNIRIKDLRNEIIKNRPDLLWLFDNSILSSELSLLIKKTVPQMMIFHDAGEIHPSNNENIQNKIRVWIETCYSNYVAKNYIEYLLLLSEESRKKYIKSFPYNERKVRKLNLGAHIIAKKEKKPPEIEDFDSHYVLFFGRIDKYKGIDKAIKAIQECQSENAKLIIAGKGDISFLSNLVDRPNDVILINRYIDDSEMIYLFKNASAVLLPYIEASQSGILPIAYYFGKPVICSNVPGLSQFVDHGKTGYIVDSDSDYSKYITCILERDDPEMSKRCKKYYSKYLSWRSNLSNMFDSL